MKRLLGALTLLGAGCAVKQPAPLTYRLIASTLVPPGVASAEVPQATFVARVRVRSCPPLSPSPISISPRGKVTVTPAELTKQPADWLAKWAAELEAKGCVAAGDGWKLATQVAESVPLDSRAAFRLLYGEAVDITPHVRIQVDSPILRDPSGPMLTSSRIDGLTVEAKASDNLLGYERAWYAVKDNHIVAISANRHINGGDDPRPQPAKNYLQFPDDAAYYRLIYKQEQTEFTALVVSGRTSRELGEFAATLSNRGANCAMVKAGYCLAIPRGVAANLFLPVMVNGKDVLVHWGGTVREAVGGEIDLATLEIYRLHNGKPAKVEFDRSNRAILKLPLVGGETISYATAASASPSIRK